MKVILTGAYGFLGKAIANHFSGRELVRLGRSSGDLVVDLSLEIPRLPACDLVIHAAGKAHIVPKTVMEKIAFHQVNVGGTANLLAGLANSSVPKYFVFISSVSVYGLDEGTLIDEDAPLLAKDAYGRSKIAAEEMVLNWCKKNEVVCSILRLPLLAGTNPPGKSSGHDPGHP